MMRRGNKTQAAVSTRSSAEGREVPSLGLGQIVRDQVDGSLVWEPLPAGAEVPPHNDWRKAALRRRLVSLLEVLSTVGLGMSGVVAAASAVQHIDRAHKTGTGLTSGQLSRAVAGTVSSAMAGLLTGLVLGPVRAATTLTGMLAKPAVGALITYRGGLWALRRLNGVSSLIRRLRTGDLLAKLEALAKLIARATGNEAFRKDFAKYSGVDLLLKLLSDALDQAEAASPALQSNPLVHLLVQALEALLKSRECTDACLRAGGVPVLVKLLACSAPAASISQGPPLTRQLWPGNSSGTSAAGSPCGNSSADPCSPVPAASAAGPVGISSLTTATLACLSHLSSLPAGRAAIREADGLPVVVAVLASAPRSASQAAALLQAQAADSAGREAVGAAGGVAALLSAVKASAPGSQAFATSLAALHSVLRGSASNQLALAQIPGSFHLLRSCPEASGSCWSGSKADLVGLLTVLARFPDLPCHALPGEIALDLPNDPTSADCAAFSDGFELLTSGGQSPTKA